MNFGEAMNLMRQRYIIRRPCWIPGAGLTIYMGELWWVMNKALDRKCNELTEKNIMALDWVAVNGKFK